MFAKTIVTSDAFLDMPPTARCLYFTLAMFADDDGFVNNPKSIMRQVGSTTDDMNILIAKKFVLVFESGVIVIKHWRIHNYIRGDRKHETKYAEEMAMLTTDDNGAYTMCQPIDGQLTDNCHTEDRLGKDRLDKDKLIDIVLIREEFDYLWSIYPKKQGKQNAFKAYKKARKDGVTYKEVKQGLDAYSNYVKGKDTQYIKMGSTFFSQRAWQDDWSINGNNGSNEFGFGEYTNSTDTEPDGWEKIFG